jgi:hypothetical protein
MIPILYIGAPGIGKTAKIRQQYDHCEILLLSSCCEEDIAGLPYREGDKEKRTMPKFVENINTIPENKTCCLFLDELDKSRREVADTLLTLITNPEYFGIKRKIDIVAAANPPEWGGGDGISQAMQSRFSVIESSVDIESFKNWALKKYTDKRIVKSIEKILKQEIPILEHVGEGYNFRLTCPRTIELAWQALLEDKKELVFGLLTKNTASGLISCFETQEDKTQNIARKIGAKALKNKNSFQAHRF